MITVDVPYETYSQSLKLKHLAQAGQPTHWIRARFPGTKIAPEESPPQSLLDAWTDYTNDLNKSAGVISFIYAIWPDEPDHPELHAYLRMPQGDTDPLHLAFTIQTPLYITTREVPSHHNNGIRDWSAIIAHGADTLYRLSSICEPVSKTQDWEL